MADEQTEAVGWILVVALTALLLVILVGLVAVGCESNLRRNDRIGVERARYKAQATRYKAQADFYRLCRRRVLAGVLPLPRGCPR